VTWCCQVFLVLFALDLVAGNFLVRYFRFQVCAVQALFSRSRCRRSDPVLFLLAVQCAVPRHWSARESLALSVHGAGRPALVPLQISVDLVRHQKLNLAAFFSLVILNWFMGNRTCSSQKLSFSVWLPCAGLDVTRTCAVISKSFELGSGLTLAVVCFSCGELALV
jgi:hypothetical protein